MSELNIIYNNEHEYSMFEETKKDLLIVILIQYICDNINKGYSSAYKYIIKKLIKIGILQKNICDSKFDTIKNNLYYNIAYLFNNKYIESIQIPTLPIQIYKNLIIGQRIGCGAESEVYKVKHTTDKNNYALKVTKYNSNIKWNTEISILSKLNNDNIIRYYNSWIDYDFNNKNKNIYLYTQVELCDMNLTSYLLKYKPNLKTKINIIKQIANGLHYIHNNNIIHRDIKCDNILVKILDDNLIIKISDFGCSKYADNITNNILPSTNDLGTIYFISPELLNNEEYNINTDIYSLGVLIFLLLSEFKTQMETDIILQNLNENNIPLSDIENKIFFVELIKNCIKKNQNDRITLNNFLEQFKKIE